MRKAAFSIWLIVVFVVSRYFCFTLGMRFKAGTISTYLQYVDPSLLRERLIESIFFLHSQPPLFNFFIGSILKIFPLHYPQVFHGLYLLTGILFFLSLFVLMRKLGVRDELAFGCTVFLMLSPEAILYENWLFYSYPVAALLCFSAVFLHKFTDKFRFRDGLAFFSLLAMLALIRSIFHLFWLFIIIGWLAASYRRQWKRIVLAAMVPFLFVAMVYFKNLIVFRTFSISAVFLNVQLAHVSISHFTKEEIDQLVQEKKLSPLTVREIGTNFYDIGRYYQRHLDIEPTGIPVLDRHLKPSGYPNYNSLLSLKTSQYYRDDALTLLRYDRRGYWRAVKQACQMYFFPGPTDVIFDNRRILEKYEDIYNFPFYHLNRINGGKLYEKLRDLHVLFYPQWDGISRVWFFGVVAVYAGLVLFTGFFLFHRFRRREGGASVTTLSFMGFNVVYNFFAHNALVYLGNNRYRFDVEAFYWAFFAFCLTIILKRFGLSNKES